MELAYLGRLRAGIVILSTLATTTHFAVKVGGEFWAVLYTMTTPLGIGLLILLVGELAGEVQKRNAGRE